MRSKRGSYTPREAAYDVALGWLSNAYHGRTADVETIDDRASYQKQLKQQIAKLHNKLLRDSKLDGVELYDGDE